MLRCIRVGRLLLGGPGGGLSITRKSVLSALFKQLSQSTLNISSFLPYKENSVSFLIKLTGYWLIS